MKLTHYDVIIRPIITEKSMSLISERKYTFIVHKNANKIQIRNAIENIFNVNVDRVFTMNYMGKMKRVNSIKGEDQNLKKL